MKMRKTSIAIVLVLGIWHTALAFSPGGEERGGKTPEQKGLQNAGVANTGSQAGLAALEAMEMASDASLPAEGVENASANTSYSKSGTNMHSIVEARRSEQLASVSKKELRKSLKSAMHQRKQSKNKHDGSVPSSPLADDMMLLCVILCFFLPPLAVYLWENEIGINFWISLVLTLFFWVPGIIFSLIVVLAT